MRKRWWYLLSACSLLGVACAGGSGMPTHSAPRDGVVEVTFLHLNDVYEITPLEGGRVGGLARVATVREDIRRGGATLVTTFGGDLFSPSAMGTARVDGRRLQGEQMVAVMNEVGLDLAVLGNHEFDIGEEAFRARLEESRFRWVAANVTDSAGHAFPGVPAWEILHLGDAEGDSVRVAVVGAVLVSGVPAWVRVGDPIAALEEAARTLTDSADVIVALTHQTIAADRELLARVPAIALVLGGHEHDAMRVPVGERLIVKTDANAASVARITMWIGAAGSEPARAEILPITQAVAEAPRVREEVDRWVERAFAGFRTDGFEPERVVVSLPTELDGREISVLTGPTELTRLIGEALRAEDPTAEAAVYNAGSIRLDDVLKPGSLSEYDVIRVLPFGGTTFTVALRGDVLAQTLEQGRRNRGTGGFLQADGVEGTPGNWTVGGSPLDPAATYRVVVPDYLLTGRERGFEFLRRGGGGLEVLAEHQDVRRSLMAQLTREFGRGGP